jgi:PAS domain S-box-containing protein
MDNRPYQASRLRRQDEEIARKETFPSLKELEALSLEEARQRLHELRAYHIELETRNEELQQSRKELEAALKRYFDLYDLAPVSYLSIDEQGLIREANFTTETLLGEPRGVLIAQPFSRHVHNQDRDTYRLHRGQLMETGERQAYDLRMLRKDGTEFWAHLTDTSVKDDDGAVMFIMALSDITERRQSEDALRCSEDRYRSLVELSPEAVFVNRNNRIVFVNQAAVRLFGASSAEELVGKDPFDFRLPEYHAIFRARNERCLAGEATTLIEGKILRPDGSIVDVEEAAAPFETGEGAAIQVILRDITERKRTEEKLRELTQRLAYHVDNSPLAVIEWGPDMRLSRWAGEAERIFGWKAGEVLGKRIEDLRWVYEEDEQLVDEASFDLRTGKNRHRFSANRNYRKDGSVIFCEWYSSALVDDAGTLRSILSLVLDITARKEAETALRESLAEKEVLLREVHHRVKNNLAAIVGLLELQKEGITDEAALHSLKELSDRIMSMSIIHEKLYRSKNMARIDFQSYLSELASQLLASYGVGSCIRCRVEAMGVEAGLDTAIPIGLIVNELVTNAIKYAFPMGVPRPGSEECEIVISALKKDDACTLAVSDNGVGMPPDLDWKSCPSLGLRLVGMLGEHQLGGQLRLDQAGGTRFVLTFSERRRDARGR